MSSVSCTVGLALDVSGSMRTSLLNSQSEQFSRLDGLQSAIDALFEEAERLSAFGQSIAGPQLRVFAYAFGLTQEPDTVDLFRVLEISQAVDKGVLPRELEEEIETMKASFERRLERDPREVAIAVMGSGAYRLLSMSRSEAESVLRREIEEHVRNRAAGAALQLAARSDLTLTFADLASRWGEMRAGIGTSNQLLGGSTPMCKCLQLVHERFRRERAIAPPDSKYILFVVSDGESSDGDPRAAAQAIEASGVQIISCFMTSSDATDSKSLYSDPAQGWNSGARAMFDIASRAPEGSVELDYLRKAGWQVVEREPIEELSLRQEPILPSVQHGGSGFISRMWLALRRKPSRTATALAPAEKPAATPRPSVAKQPKMFAQVNHSAHLEEFIKVILTPIQLEHGR